MSRRHRTDRRPRSQGAQIGPFMVVTTAHALARFFERFPKATEWDTARAHRILRMLALTGDDGRHAGQRHGRILWGDGTHTHCVVAIKRDPEHPRTIYITTVFDPMAPAEPA